MGTMIIKRMPDELRNQFKAACAAKGKTMREELIRLMQEAVEKYRKEKL
jgi:plasmid stability protein